MLNDPSFDRDEFPHEMEWDLSETCPHHPGVRVVSRCGRFDAPCTECEAEMDADYLDRLREDYKAVAKAACAEFARHGLTPEKFNELARQELDESGVGASPDAWVEAARCVADAYREIKGHDTHCHI